VQPGVPESQGIASTPGNASSFSRHTFFYPCQFRTKCIGKWVSLSRTDANASTTTSQDLGFRRGPRTPAFRRIKSRSRADQVPSREFGMYDAGKMSKYTALLFNFGKFFSFFMVLVCLVAFVVGIVQYFAAAPDRLQEPDFTSFKPYLGLPGERVVEQDFSRIDTKRAIENKYDAILKRIVTDFNFETQFYGQIVDWMSHVPENRRSRFVAGLHSFLEGFRDWMEENKDTLQLNGEQSLELYHNMAKKYEMIFSELLRKEENRWKTSFQERTNLLLFIISTLTFLILFLMVPILLRIEENTRFFK
jgi:hypothetical protein